MLEKKKGCDHGRTVMHNLKIQLESSLQGQQRSVAALWGRSLQRTQPSDHHLIKGRSQDFQRKR